MKTTTPITVIQEQIEEFILTVVNKKEKPKRKVRKRKPSAKNVKK
jgi:hypothetical protein